MIGYDDMVRLKGGILHKRMSISNPDGNFFAQCAKHPEYWQQLYISFDVFTQKEKPVRDFGIAEAQRIIDACPQCKSEQKEKDEYQTTRFPEGAEL